MATECLYDTFKAICRDNAHCCPFCGLHYQLPLKYGWKRHWCPVKETWVHWRGNQVNVRSEP